jgi:hypothetical protein
VKANRRSFLGMFSAGVAAAPAFAAELSNATSEIYELELRHRAAVNESIRDRHHKFMQAMARYAPPWGLKGLPIPPARDVAPGDLVAVVTLRGLTANDKWSYLKHTFRSERYLRDTAQFDDIAIIHFKIGAAAHRLRELFDEVLPAYVEAFDCYKATICDPDIRLGDWDRVVQLSNSSGKDVDGRDGVYRIHPANYFDSELCGRAFGLAPEKIIERLQGKVEKVSAFRDGLLLVCDSSIPLSRDEYERMDAGTKSLLK